jgi:hypothetical protein
MGVPDDMTDDRWAREAVSIGRGWHPGRVPCSGVDGPAFGWIKGSFGIFEAGGETEIGRLELSSLTHRKTGMRVALFEQPTSAAIAGDLAERVGDWTEIDARGMSPVWQARAKKMYRLWQSAGLIYGPLHCGGKHVWCAPEPVEKTQ